MTDLIVCQSCGDLDESGYCQKCLLIEKLDQEHWEEMTNDVEGDDD